MIQFFEDYLNRLHTLHAGIEQDLEGLPQEALDWKPQPDMNSLVVLIVHIAGSARFWIGDIAMEDSSNRNRDAEFQAAGQSIETLTNRLKDTEAYIKAALSLLTLEDLEELRRSPRDGHQYTVAYCLLHALEHTAIHAGHIQITSQLWKETESG